MLCQDWMLIKSENGRVPLYVVDGMESGPLDSWGVSVRIYLWAGWK
jgi:hypothetical protein